ncbi:hypothetical protein GCM10027073_35790 [Streptomyces chlorus]
MRSHSFTLAGTGGIRRLPHPGSRVTDMPEPRTRLRAGVIAPGSPYPLVLTGGWAVRPHRAVPTRRQDRPGRVRASPCPVGDAQHPGGRGDSNHSVYMTSMK